MLLGIQFGPFWFYSFSSGIGWWLCNVFPFSGCGQKNYYSQMLTSPRLPMSGDFPEAHRGKQVPGKRNKSGVPSAGSNTYTEECPCDKPHWNSRTETHFLRDVWPDKLCCEAGTLQNPQLAMTVGCVQFCKAGNGEAEGTESCRASDTILVLWENAT